MREDPTAGFQGNKGFIPKKHGMGEHEDSNAMRVFELHGHVAHVHMTFVMEKLLLNHVGCGN